MQTSTTPVPNVLFDIHVKELKSAELKVLLIIIRQTLGWSDKKGSNGRKEVDWISGSQLQQKTGCSRRAITSATDTLVKKHLIQILDEKGNCLNSPEQRQGKTKLFYRLYNPVDNRVNINSTSAKFTQEMSKKVTALVQKMHITKETLQN
jgi:hypothetical protein